MLTADTKNLLPKGITDRVALKTFISQHQLSWFRGFRKLQRTCRFAKFSKLSLGAILLLYLSGYQPTLNFPPLKENIARAEFSQEELIKSGTFNQTFYLPHPGYITTRFFSWHPGIDIATGYGMPVHPISGGKVIEVTLGWFGLGHFVVIEHAEGFKSTYGHMGRVFVKKDDQVNPTSILGEVGMTGRTTGPHTHLEVSRNDQYIDPLTILPPLANWPANAGTAPKGQRTLQITPAPIQPDHTLMLPAQKMNLINIENPKPAKEVKPLPLPKLQLDRI